MSFRFADLMFTPAVQALQSENGSRAAYARMPAHGEGSDALSEREAGFLRAADHFYLATVSETGWPYVQHRGGPAGFIRVLGPRRIAFADFRGNQQFVSAGNSTVNDRCAMIVMDYANPTRLKLIGRLKFVRLDDLDGELFDVAELSDYRARVERVAVIDIEGFDWNCPQHITPRYTVGEIEELTQPRIQQLQTRIAELEAQLARQG
jgi:predicted pyridoxine 5'-phosphate oxidase superfamily flavin-nucleotide-binding protein